MIYELNPSQFKSISHLLDGERINLEIRAVVEGYNPGCVFVDNVMEPHTAMVWSKGIKGFYFLGDVNSIEFNNSLKTYIKYIIAPRAHKQDLNTFEFSGTSLEWEAKLEKIFEDQDLSISSQYVYKRPKNLEITSPSIGLDETFEVVKVDKNLFEQSQLDLHLLQENINDWWGNVGSFNEHGTGYCILHENQAVCSCLTSSFDGREIQSHIVTLDAFRKRGLATVAVAEFVKEAKSQELELYWDCMEKNAGSRALAEKLGYVKAYEYKLFEFDI